METNIQVKRGVKEAKGLSVGKQAPAFKAIDANGNQFSLVEALKIGPVVLIFYRGHWCPFCSKHLKQVQDELIKLTKKGVTVVAVSPEKPEFQEKMAGKTGAKFALLYDEGYLIADAFDVTFTPKAPEIFIYNTFLSAGLKKTHSDESQRLPIPATYIIGQDGTIVWRHFDPDYKKRSSVADIVKNLPVKTIKNQKHHEQSIT
jgi:peroxiredoxin